LSPFSRLNDMLPINCHETKAQEVKKETPRKDDDKQGSSVGKKSGRKDEL